MIKKVSLEELLSEQQIILPVDISDTEDLEIALNELDDNLQIIQDTLDQSDTKTISNIKTDKWSDGIKVYHPLKSINDLVKICINTFIKTGSAVRSHDLNTCSAALQFAVISLKVAK